MKKIKEFLIDKVKLLVVALVIALLIDKFLFGFAVVEGQSMYPTLNTRDRILVLKLSLISKHPDVGDIVIFNPPHLLEEELFIKRVVAKSGDSFKLADGLLYINDERQEEAYVAKEAFMDKGYSVLEGTVPEGMIFVMGDNRNDSNDSRSFGFVEMDHIKGRALVRIWPLKEIQVFLNPY